MRFDGISNREKSALYRWIYGDPGMPHNKYHEYRLGADFRTYDAKIDEPRKAEAWQNFELLMKVRKSTQDVRVGVQKIIADVVSERRTLADVRAELDTHQQELLSHFVSEHTVRVDVGLAGVGLAVAIAEAIGTLSGLVPGVSPVGPGLAAYGLWRARSERQKYTALRKRYPLAWLLRDFEHIQSVERRKRVPRRRRRAGTPPSA